MFAVKAARRRIWMDEFHKGGHGTSGKIIDAFFPSIFKRRIIDITRSKCGYFHRQETESKRVPGTFFFVCFFSFLFVLITKKTKLAWTDWIEGNETNKKKVADTLKIKQFLPTQVSLSLRTHARTRSGRNEMN